MTYRLGQTIDLPPEPPVGTVLAAADRCGRYEIERLAAGWRVRGTRAGQEISWRAVFIAWGPGSLDGQAFTVVRLPPG